jgi:predicted TIM-barrel fold metal-dependent hydrolase
MHVHIEGDAAGHTSLPPDLAEAASKYFSAASTRPDLDHVAAFYRERRMAAVVFTVDATTRLGHPALSSVEIAAGAARHNDVLIPFGSVDPLQAGSVVDQARRLVEQHGVRGFKFHPTVQGFDPSDQTHYPLYAEIERLGVPALFHTGQTGIGAGMRGGYGFRLGLSNPILLDPVAADFPDLQIIMAHPSVPWQDEALAVATHKHNTWIDLSGWSPKYFPTELIRYANSVLKDRVLFGSDFPLLLPDRWIRDAEQTALKSEVMPRIMKGNAARLLGMSGSKPAT